MESIVWTMERLGLAGSTGAMTSRLLLVLTVVDIRAVGPGVWNSWKRQLLTELYDAAEEVLRLGHKQKGREQRIASKKEAVAAQFGFDQKTFDKVARRLPESYWIAEPVEVIAANLFNPALWAEYAMSFGIFVLFAVLGVFGTLRRAR